MKTPIVKMSFFDDVAQIAAKRLRAEGYAVSSSDSSEELLHKYVNALRRRITRRSRAVYIAREFRCPPKHQAAFAEIRRKAEAGEDLVPHQSRKVLKPDYNDALLNDWDIHHLHLSTKVDPRRIGLLEGTSEVLFVRITANAMYCLTIMGHGEWEDKTLIEILHKNWPETLTAIKGVRGENLNKEEIRNLRNAHVNVAIEMDDGTVYGIVGGGSAASGLNIEVVRKVDQLRALCGNLEEQIRDRITSAVDIERGKGNIPPLTYSFSLDENNRTWSAIDTNIGLQITLRPPLLRPL
jgi:hypothetical protein